MKPLTNPTIAYRFSVKHENKYKTETFKTPTIFHIIILIYKKN